MLLINFIIRKRLPINSKATNMAFCWGRFSLSLEHLEILLIKP